MRFEAWSDLVFARYRGARRSGAAADELRELRRRLRNGADQHRGKYRSRAGRLWTADSTEGLLGELLLDELAENEINSAEFFYAVEAGKARLLLDLMCVPFQDFPTAETHDSAAARERAMLRFTPDDKSDLIYSEMRLCSLLSIGTQWDKDTRYQTLAAIEAFYSQHQAGFIGVAQPVELPIVQNALQSGELMLEYCIPHHPLHPAKELVLLAITRQHVAPIRLSLSSLPASGFIGRMAIDGRQPLDVSPLGEQVINLRMAIQSADEARSRRLLRFFYQLLIAPLQEAGIRLAEFQRLIIIPHGVLHYLPFAALLSGQSQHLIEQAAIVVSPSASVWHHVQAAARPRAASFFGLGNPSLSSAGLPALEAAEREIERIARILQTLSVETHCDAAATEEVLRAHIGGKSLVHLATHGDFPEEDAIDFHRILLSPSATHDGRLSADELRRMDLSTVRLFVLSVCNGGLYRFGPGDEPYGLISAAFSAGVENLVGTLWPLEDAIGRLFMVEFYKHLLREGPAGALQKACKQFIDDQALPSHWAGFVLAGAGRPFS